MSRPVCDPRALSRTDVTHSQHVLQKLSVTLSGPVFAPACVTPHPTPLEGSREQKAYVPKISLRPHVPLRGCNRHAKWEFWDVQLYAFQKLHQKNYGSDDFEAPYSTVCRFLDLAPPARLRSIADSEAWLQQIGENVTRTERHTPRSHSICSAAPRRRPRLDPDGGAGPGAAGGPRADVGEVVLLLRPQG